MRELLTQVYHDRRNWSGSLAVTLGCVLAVALGWLAVAEWLDFRARVYANQVAITDKLNALESAQNVLLKRLPRHGLGPKPQPARDVSSECVNSVTRLRDDVLASKLCRRE